MRGKWILIAPLAIVGMALFGFIGGKIVEQLWNWLAPDLFGWRQVTFWQALGLLVLCRILFGGSGFMRGNARQRSPEDRERFRQAVRKRFGFGPSTAVPPPSA